MALDSYSVGHKVVSSSYTLQIFCM